MSTPQKACEDIKNLAQRFKGFIEVGELLEKIGNIEQAERDAVSRMNQAYLAAEEADKAKVLAEEDLRIAKSKIEHAKAEALKIEQAAYDQRLETLKSAAERGQEIVKEAEAKKSAILSEIAGHRSGLEQVQIQIVESRKELDDLKAKIEEVKSKFSALLK